MPIFSSVLRCAPGAQSRPLANTSFVGIVFDASGNLDVANVAGATFANSAPQETTWESLRQRAWTFRVIW